MMFCYKVVTRKIFLKFGLENMSKMKQTNISENVIYNNPFLSEVAIFHADTYGL